MTRNHSLSSSGQPTGARRGVFRHRDQKGAALVEFAMVVGLFVFLLYGLISFGMILAAKQRITNAAAEGARAAVGQTSSPTAISAATARIAAAGLPAGAVPTYSTGSCGGNQCITVTIELNLNTNPIVPPAPGLGLVTPNKILSKAVVQYA